MGTRIKQDSDNTKIKMELDKISVPESKDPDTITFLAKRFTIEGETVNTEWPHGFPLDFENIDKLVFDNGETKVTYKRV